MDTSTLTRINQFYAQLIDAVPLLISMTICLSLLTPLLEQRKKGKIQKSLLIPFFTFIFIGTISSFFIGNGHPVVVDFIITVTGAPYETAIFACFLFTIACIPLLLLVDNIINKTTKNP